MPRASKPEQETTEAEESVSGAGRPNDLPIVAHPAALPNSTFRTRGKRVGSAQNKAVKPADAEDK